MKKYLFPIVFLFGIHVANAQYKNEISIAYNAIWHFDKYPLVRSYSLFPYYSYRRTIREKHGVMFHIGELYANYRTVKTPDGRSLKNLPENSIVEKKSVYVGIGYFFKKNVADIFDNRFNVGIQYRPITSNLLLLTVNWFEARVQNYGTNHVFGFNVGNSIKKKIYKRWALNADVQYIHYFNNKTERSGYDGSELTDPQLNTIFFNIGASFSF